MAKKKAPPAPKMVAVPIQVLPGRRWLQIGTVINLDGLPGVIAAREAVLLFSAGDAPILREKGKAV